MNSDPTALLRDLRPGETEQIGELFPSERRTALLESIVGGTPQPVADRKRRAGARVRHPVRGRGSARSWRPAIISALAAGAASTVVAVTLSTTSDVGPAPAEAVTFATAPSGAIVATVTEPFAAQSRLDAAFASQGLKITVNLLPVSPSIVGTVLGVGESNSGAAQIRSLQGGNCLMGGGGCPIGVEIPRGFTGTGSITLGRPAKPGERYQSSASLFAPGEPLHCSGLLGSSVADALPVLRSDTLTVVDWREVTESSPGVSSSVTLAAPPAQNYVWGAELVEPGRVRVDTERAPWPDTPGAGAQFNRGC